MATLRAAAVLALAAAACGARVAQPAALRSASGSVKECVNGKVHSLEYTTVGVDGAVYTDLDTIDHLEHVTCDLDHTRLQLIFSSEIYADEWYIKFHDFNTHFLIGGEKWNCSVIQKNRPSVIIRRVVGAQTDNPLTKYVNVQASEARYDEIFEDASIQFSTLGACDAATYNADKKVCVGYNSDCTGTATSSIPIFSNKFVSLACSDCFVDFTMDVFFNLNIQGFQVANLSTGFKDIAINASAVISAQAQANWNTGIDKTMPLLQNTYLVNFKVGAIPFMIYFDMPVEMKGSFTFTSETDASIGAAMNMGFGEASVKWDPKNHWTHVMPTPQISFVPSFVTHAQFSAEGTFALVPTLNAHFDRILSYSLQATPTLDATIQGSEASKQICMDSTYDVSVNAQTVLDINIPWANIAKDWTWNKDVYESGTQKIWQKCIGL